MALFQRQPITISQYVPYSISLEENHFLFVGLGNPGKEYIPTRHNIGFLAIDNFALNRKFPDFKNSSKFEGQLSENIIESNRITLLKPQSFMNNSGSSIQKVSSFYKIKPENIIVIHDELDVPFGQIRTRVGGNDAGHNGIKSVISHLGNNFGRIRIGIKNELYHKSEAKDFVLKSFTKEEKNNLQYILSESNSILEEVIYKKKIAAETRNIII